MLINLFAVVAIKPSMGPRAASRRMSPRITSTFTASRRHHNYATDVVFGALVERVTAEPHTLTLLAARSLMVRGRSVSIL